MSTLHSRYKARIGSIAAAALIAVVVVALNTRWRSQVTLVVRVHVDGPELLPDVVAGVRSTLERLSSETDSDVQVEDVRCTDDGVDDNRVECEAAVMGWTCPLPFLVACRPPFRPDDPLQVAVRVQRPTPPPVRPSSWGTAPPRDRPPIVLGPPPDAVYGDCLGVEPQTLMMQQQLITQQQLMTQMMMTTSLMFAR